MRDCFYRAFNYLALEHNDLDSKDKKYINIAGKKVMKQHDSIYRYEIKD